MTTFVVDGNFYLARHFHVSATNKDPAYVEKNVLSSFFSSVVNDIIVAKATHVAITFDAPNGWRYDIYPDYKIGRRAKKDPITVNHPKYSEPQVLRIQSGSELVPDAKKLCKAAGFAVFHRKRLEADDLIHNICHQIPGNIVVGTRDKDMAALVNERVSLYWPIEKTFMGPKQIRDFYGIDPKHMRDFLSLIGDKVDSIPGCEGIGGVTAAKWLLKYGSIKNALAKDPKIADKLRPQKANLILSQKLVSFKTVDLGITLDDLVIKDPDKDYLKQALWSIPKNFDSMADASKASKLKGLFGK